MQFLDTGDVSDAVSVLKLTDLSTAVNSSGLYCTKIADVTDITLLAKGYSETTVGTITTDAIAEVTIS